MSDLEELRQRLSPGQRALLSGIWDYWMERKDWIPRRVLHQKFEELRSSGVRAALEDLGGSVVREVGYGDNAVYQLTDLGVLLTDDGDEAEGLLVRYLEYVRKTFRANPEVIRVHSGEVNLALGLSPEKSANL